MEGGALDLSDYYSVFNIGGGPPVAIIFQRGIHLPPNIANGEEFNRSVFILRRALAHPDFHLEPNEIQELDHMPPGELVDFARHVLAERFDFPNEWSLYHMLNNLQQHLLNQPIAGYDSEEDGFEGGEGGDNMDIEGPPGLGFRKTRKVRKVSRKVSRKVTKKSVRKARKSVRKVSRKVTKKSVRKARKSVRKVSKKSVRKVRKSVRK